jgi:hypothetical protein
MPSLWSDRIGNERNQVVARRRMQRKRHTHLPAASPQLLWQRESLSSTPGNPCHLHGRQPDKQRHVAPRCSMLHRVAACCNMSAHSGLPAGHAARALRAEGCVMVGASEGAPRVPARRPVCLRVQHVSARAKILRVAAGVKMPERLRREDGGTAAGSEL